MKTLQDRIDAIREEFQEQRPDVVMVLDDVVAELETADNLARSFLCELSKHGIVKIPGE